LPYIYGTIGCMKKTLNIDEELLREAKEACGATTDTEAVKKGLEALLRHAANQRTRSFFGMEPDAVDVPRRREKPREKPPVGRAHR
jgi:Arc/MetJ family transcription regulator